MLPSVYGRLTDIHTSAKVPLGSEYSPDGGKTVYKYLQGIGSTAAKEAVTFNSAFLTARLVADAVGPVAIAMAAVLASQFGWYQVKGLCSVKSDTVAAAGVALYIDGTTGRVDDAVVSGDLILNAFAAGADATNVLAAYINYPSVNNILG